MQAQQTDRWAKGQFDSFLGSEPRASAEDKLLTSNNAIKHKESERGKQPLHHLPLLAQFQFILAIHHRKSTHFKPCSPFLEEHGRLIPTTWLAAA